MSSVLLQNKVGETTAVIHRIQLTPLSGGPPASDPHWLASREVMPGRGQTDWPDVLVECDRTVQFHKSYVIVISLGLVARVLDDLFKVLLQRPLVSLTLNMKSKVCFPLLRLRISVRKHTLSSRSSILKTTKILKAEL